MCDPMTALAVASAGASVGGAVHNATERNAAADATRSAQEREAARRRQAQLDEQARQEALTQQASAVAARSLAQTQRPAVQAAQEEAFVVRREAVDAATGRVAPDSSGENPLLQPTAMAQGVTVQDAARVTSERLAAARAGMLGNAFLRAVADQQAAGKRALGTAASDLAGIGATREGSRRAYGVDLNREAEAFRPSAAPWGDVAMAAGTLGTMAAGRAAGTARAGGGPNTYSLDAMNRPGFTPPGGLY